MDKLLNANSTFQSDYTHNMKRIMEILSGVTEKLADYR